MSSPSWNSAGKQEFRVDGDQQFLRLHGILEEDELRQITESGRAIALREGYYIVICDGANARGMSADARRYNAAFRKNNQELLGTSIVYGSDLMARIIIGLIARAMYLLSIIELRVLFVKDEAEALAVAQTERKQLQAEAARRRNAR